MDNKSKPVSSKDEKNVFIKGIRPIGRRGPTGHMGLLSAPVLLDLQATLDLLDLRATQQPLHTIRTVTIAAPGATADATITGTPPNFVLNNPSRTYWSIMF